MKEYLTMSRNKGEGRYFQVYVPHFEVVNWSPKARVSAGVTGVVILVLGQRTKGLLRQLASFAGLGLVLRSLTNKDLTQIIGTLLSPTIRLSREIVIEASPNEIASFWSKIENYPRFMSFVSKVGTSRSGNLLWEIAGPGGVPMRWEAHILSWAPSHEIAWRTVPGSPIFNSGQVRIRSLGFGRSRVQVELTYALRAGRLGYAAAKVLGFDPRAHIDSDLQKMKALIEEESKNRREAELPWSA